MRRLVALCCVVGLVTACSANAEQVESTFSLPRSTSSQAEEQATTTQPTVATTASSGTTPTRSTLSDDDVEMTLDPGRLSETTIDLLDGSRLEVVGPSELQPAGYLFTIEVPGILSSNVDLSRDADPADPAAVDQAAVLESDLGNGIRLWRANREGQPFYMTVDLGGWAAFLHVGNEPPPDTELLSLADQLSAQTSGNGVILHDYSPDFFTTYLSDPNTENQVHLGANKCVRELIPGADVVEDRTLGEVIRGEEYASWCDEAAEIEVMVYGDEQFVEQVINDMTLTRNQPRGS
ncbi:MAG: hypothetical protein ACLFRT_15265 [Actinomycetota bacterium]